jgi:hypothetical protein
MTSRSEPSHQPATAVKRIARGIGLAALAGTIVPPALFLAGVLGQVPMQRVMLVAAVAWFAAAAFWMDVE